MRALYFLCSHILIIGKLLSDKLPLISVSLWNKNILIWVTRLESRDWFDSYVLFGIVSDVIQKTHLPRIRILAMESCLNFWLNTLNSIIVVSLLYFTFPLPSVWKLLDICILFILQMKLKAWILEFRLQTTISSRENANCFNCSLGTLYLAITTCYLAMINLLLELFKRFK